MINSTTLFITILLAMTTFVVPRRYILLPYILAACFVPTDQRIIFMNLEFTALRILIVAGVLRIIIRGEYINFRWNNFDMLVMAWILCGAIVYILQWMDMKAIKNRSGVVFDVIGLYWLFRQTLRSWSDVEFTFRMLAMSVLCMAPLVAIEWKTGHNPFAALGTVITDVREGRYRCQASFPHSIMLGLFWANIVPIFIGFAVAMPRRIFYWTAVGAAVFVVSATASSTPIATMLEILLLLALFQWRRHGKLMAYGLCGLLVILHIVREQPIWHLIARVNIIGGSTGWHRYHLIDQTINHFGQWVMLGVRDTSRWGYGLEDVTNQYILEGVRGGLVTLVLFIVLLVMAVRIVGRYSLRAMPVRQQWFVWCICVAILGHCLSFIGVSYFGQIKMQLYLILAVVGMINEMSQNASSVNVSMPVIQTDGRQNGRFHCYS